MCKLTEEKIDAIERANYFIKNTIHMIKIKGTDKIKEESQGTRFMYSKLLLAMMYEKFGNCKNTTKEKINSLISDLENNINLKKFFIDITDEDYMALETLEIDNSMNRKQKEDLLSIIKKIKNQEKIEKNELVTLFMAITKIENKFFYNNIEAKEAIKNQEKRLAIFSNFIEKLSDLFVEVMKNKKQKNIEENLGL